MEEQEGGCSKLCEGDGREAASEKEGAVTIAPPDQCDLLLSLASPFFYNAKLAFRNWGGRIRGTHCTTYLHTCLGRPRAR